MSRIALNGNALGTGTVTLAAPNTNSDRTVTLPDNTGTIALTSDVSSFPVGTAMMFVQTAAPTGWTKSTTHDNKALRVVSGSASSGGSTAFTTAFGTPTVSGSVSLSGTVGGTTLTTAQIPSHNHNGYAGSEWSIYGNAGFNSQSPSGLRNDPVRITGSTGGGGSHDHSFSGSGSLSSATAAINVSYVDVIIATKD
jgi:hypothetical protein